MICGYSMSCTWETLRDAVDDQREAMNLIKRPNLQRTLKKKVIGSNDLSADKSASR
jgi:hypothetical protein